MYIGSTKVIVVRDTPLPKFSLICCSYSNSVDGFLSECNICKAGSEVFHVPFGVYTWLGKSAASFTSKRSCLSIDLYSLRLDAFEPK